MGTSCTRLHMFYVANKGRESETSAYYNLYAFVILFFNRLKTTRDHGISLDSDSGSDLVDNSRKRFCQYADFPDMK